MNVKMRILIAGLMVAAFVTVQASRAQVKADEAAAAAESAKDAPAKCCSEGGDCAKCGTGECPMSVAMDQLPKMTFMVGTEETCCSASAQQLAKDKKEAVKFVVAGKTYESEGEAMTALADATDEFVDNFAAPHTCQVSGKTSLAGQEMDCAKSAEKVANAMRDAMKTIAISYKVGEKTCSCPNEAKTLAKEAGTEPEFVVGTETTHCPIDARIKLAHAKFKAALEAWHKVVASSETKPETTEAQGS